MPHLLTPRIISLLLLLGWSVLLSGCGENGDKARYLEAVQLEQEGKHESALRIYESLVPQVAPEERRWLAEILLRMGDCYLRLERPAEAFTSFQRSVEAAPDNVTAHLRLGELYLATGAVDRALDHANLVLREAPMSLDALAVIGLAHAISGNDQDAKQIFLRVLALDPRRLQVALALADVFGREGRIDEARDVLARATLSEPGLAGGWLARARLEEQVGNTPAAEEYYRRAVEAENTRETNWRLAQFLQRGARIQESEEVLRHLDSLPDAPPTAVADFALLAGRPQEALERYRSLLVEDREEANKQSKAGARRGGLAARMIAAELEAARSAPDPDARLAAARRALERNRERLGAEACAVLETEIALLAGDLLQARTHAEAAMAAAPESPAARYVKGAVLYRAGSYAEAVAEWHSALERDPLFVPARLALAAHALSSGDSKVSVEYVVPVVREEPANLRALLLYGRALLAGKQYAAAGIIAARAQVLSAQDPEALLLLGEIALESGRTGEALARYQQATLMAPDSATAVEGLARVYRSDGLDSKMLRRMEAVAAAEPGSATLMEVTGRLYAEAGMLDDALRCLSRALEMEPRRRTAAAALAAVQARAGAMQDAAKTALLSGGYSAALVAALRAQERDDVEFAIRQYEAALRHGDRSGTAANNLAWLYAGLERELDRALELANRARTLAPHNPAVLDTLGFVHMKRREYTQAIEALEAAARLAEDPKTEVGDRLPLLAAIRRNLEEAYLRAGRSEDAARLRQAD